MTKTKKKVRLDSGLQQYHQFYTVLAPEKRKEEESVEF